MSWSRVNAVKPAAARNPSSSWLSSWFLSSFLPIHTLASIHTHPKPDRTHAYAVTTCLAAAASSFFTLRGDTTRPNARQSGTTFPHAACAQRPSSEPE
jgi:hypothetical protein